MSHACGEYEELSRRQFVQASMLTGLSASILASSPAWLPRVSFAKEPSGPTLDVVVSIYLRGGIDGLSVVVPFTDPGYATPSVRPNLRVAAPDDTSVPVGRRALAIGNSTIASGSSVYDFGLHPALAALLPAYQDGKLLLAHATGLVGTNKSHFDAQRWMENGQPASNTLFTGWLGRHLAGKAPVNASSAIRAIGVADGLQRTLAGSPKALPIPNLQNNPGAVPLLNNIAAVSATNSNGYGLTGTSSTSAARRANIGAMYTGTTEPLAQSAADTLATITRLNQIGAAGYTPAGGAVYPETALGRTMRTSAALIEANNNANYNQFVEAIAIDVGGWDTHAGQYSFNNTTGVFTGSMVTNMTALAEALNAFYRDLIVSRGRSVTVVITSEFGRRVGENGTTGTDHGFGNVMMVLGSAVLGGRVLTNWTGLPTGSSPTNFDVPVTMDIRHLLAEMIDRRLGNAGSLGAIFPGFTPVYRNIFA
ncbi:MAG: DUF1501 domain-containing protein [Phycisphaerales bacterium]